MAGITGTNWRILTFNGNSEKHGVHKIFRPSAQVNHFDLYQNYPNSFNGATTIRYDLVNTAEVEWRIYSRSGRLIQHKEMRLQVAGPHSFSQDGQNINGEPLTSGIYYFRLAASKFERPFRCSS